VLEGGIEDKVKELIDNFPKKVRKALKVVLTKK
jgi:hypothetical protein